MRIKINLVDITMKEIKCFLCLLFVLSISLIPSSIEAGNTKWKAHHVIIFGLDGWAAHNFSQENIPNIKGVMKNGSYTLKKRSVLPSISTVNWASMFMGVGPELHGYTNNTKLPDLPSRVVNKDNIFPTIFSVFREQYPKAEIGCFYQWDGIKYVLDTLALNKNKQFAEDMKSSPVLCEAAEKYIKEEHPNLALFYFAFPDDIGHSSGWYSNEYNKALEELDGYIGRIVKAVKDAGILDDTIFIITSDHGGHDNTHGTQSMLDMETPFIIYGKDIKRNHEIQSSMMQFDVAATIAYIFNLKQPQVWIGRPMKEVFNK
jgi:predicted AlkP superfamily pyrophosphatase or phosphodiesterase